MSKRGGGKRKWERKNVEGGSGLVWVAPGAFLLLPHCTIIRQTSQKARHGGREKGRGLYPQNQRLSGGPFPSRLLLLHYARRRGNGAVFGAIAFNWMPICNWWCYCASFLVDGGRTGQQYWVNSRVLRSVCARAATVFSTTQYRGGGLGGGLKQEKSVETSLVSVCFFVLLLNSSAGCGARRHSPRTRDPIFFFCELQLGGSRFAPWYNRKTDPPYFFFYFSQSFPLGRALFVAECWGRSELRFPYKSLSGEGRRRRVFMARMASCCGPA